MSAHSYVNITQAVAFVKEKFLGKIGFDFLLGIQ